MNAKEAIKAAKAGFAELFADEPVQDVGFEEIDFDVRHKVWNVTLGFRRTLVDVDPFRMSFPTERIYKIVSLQDEDGRVISVKNREFAQV